MITDIRKVGDLYEGISFTHDQLRQMSDLMEKLIGDTTIGTIPDTDPGGGQRMGPCGDLKYARGDVIKVLDFIIAFRDITTWASHMKSLLALIDPMIELPHKPGQ